MVTHKERDKRREERKEEALNEAIKPIIANIDQIKHAVDEPVIAKKRKSH